MKFVIRDEDSIVIKGRFGSVCAAWDWAKEHLSHNKWIITTRCGIRIPFH